MRFPFAAAALVLMSLAAIVPDIACAQTTPTANAKTKPGAAAAQAGKPADYRSQNFYLHTDLSAADAKELLTRLETMLRLISGYWGRKPSGIIECYVVQDLKNWSPDAFDPHGLAQIQAGAGVTLTTTLRVENAFLAKSVVYAVADRGTPQHEAVHAYCGQTFGTTGPLWYAEGMAEMGQYWQDGSSAVNVHAEVMKYLQATTPKRTMREILDTNSKANDNWQNYAWRWALCHLLANNPNYAAKFRPLGIGLLTKQPVSFEQTYGPVADQISFEYDFFLRHVDNGYRADLCAWDWKRKFARPVGSTATNAKILAARGWQPSGVLLVADTEYEYSAAGTWQTSKTSTAVSADGAEDGGGRMLGIVLKDFQLSEPFELGAYGTFKAPADGQLYLRCRDAWHELADNLGTLNVRLKLKGQGDPLPRPVETAKSPSQPVKSPSEK